MWDNLGRTFAEFFHIRRDLSPDGRIAFEPLEMLRGDRARGAVSSSARLHMGNWEILSQAALRFGVPLAGVYQRITNPYVDEWLLKGSARPSIPAASSKNRPRTARPC